jgi:hypothetical protein
MRMSRDLPLAASFRHFRAAGALLSKPARLAPLGRIAKLEELAAKIKNPALIRDCPPPTPGTTAQPLPPEGTTPVPPGASSVISQSLPSATIRFGNRAASRGAVR